MSDYMELNLYLEDYEEEGPTIDLWVYFDHNDFIIINDVIRDPVRYDGWWTIPFMQYNRYAAAHIEASKVQYFVTVNKEPESQ